MKQPDVLDGDHGLVSKGLEQLNLIVREWPDLRTTNRYSSNGHALSQQRRDKYGSSTSNLLRNFGIRIFGLDLRQYVVNMNRLTVEHSATNRKASTKWQYIEGRHCPVFRHDAKLVTFRATYHTIDCITQPRGILGDHIKNRLNVGR